MVLGKAKVMLQCEAGKRIYTTVYVMAETENLLGERDAVALGILTIKPKGDRPSQETVETTDREDKGRKLETQLEKLQAKQRVATSCQTCSKSECYACQQAEHFRGAPICPGPSTDGKSGTGNKKKKRRQIRNVSASSDEDTYQ